MTQSIIMTTYKNAIGARRSLFNMIEVALAIAIVAIGLSSIMVLFPVGLNATSAAITDDNIPDTAEYILSYLEGLVVSKWRDGSGKAQLNTLFTNLQTKPIDDEVQTKLKHFNEGAQNSSRTNDDGILKISDNIFRFQKIVKLSDSGDERIDFEVDALVWAETAHARSLEIVAEGFEGTVDKQLDMKAAVELCVELSWPVEKPYVMREKRLYRLTLVNPAADANDL